MHARQLLAAREAREVALVPIHPRAEPLPQVAGIGLAELGAVDDDTQAPAHGAATTKNGH
jgi:hypothetical protein